MILFPLVVLLLLPVLWYGTGFLMSVIGGWDRLAEIYPGPADPPAETRILCGCKVGAVRYNGLRFCSSPPGLYLSAGFPLRSTHPPLLIPWDAICNVTTHHFLWLESVNFEVGSPSIVTLRLPKKSLTGRHLVLMNTSHETPMPQL